jgi:Family of unknown function (DUF5908)
MPIEIRELVIRATVDPGESGGAGGCEPLPSKDSTRSSSSPQAGAEDDVVQSCVREVLRILDDKRER